MPTEKFERLDTARIAQILSVSLDEFARHRYQDASFNRIIRNCRMAKGTMYYYFKSKDDLFLTLYKATVREFGALVRHAQRPAVRAEEFWGWTHELLHGFWSILQQKPSIALFVTNFLIRSSGPEGHPAAPKIEVIDQWLTDTVRRGQTLGALRSDLSAELLTSLLWGLWEGYRPWALLNVSEGQERPGVDQLLELCERLLRPGTPASPVQ